MTTPQAGLTPEEVAALYAKLEKIETLPPEEQMQPSAATQALVREVNAEIQRMSPQQQKELQQKQLAKAPAFQPLDMLLMMEGSLMKDFQEVSQRVAAEQKNKTLSLADQIAAMNAKANVAQAITGLQGAIAQETQREEAQLQARKPSGNHGQYL
jgi:hypothetical protein